MRLVVGLGNPGVAYEKTRHNMGFLVVRAFAKRHGLAFKEERKFHAQVARGQVGEQGIDLLMPTTYMNLSGQAVRSYTDYYRIPPEEILVVCDDADLPFGTLRVRERGSSGGHRGLEDIEHLLGTRAYPRLRIGIGRRGEKGSLAGHVLGKFTADEDLEGVVSKGADVLELALRVPLEEVMNRTNRRESVRSEKEDEQKS